MPCVLPLGRFCCCATDPVLGLLQVYLISVVLIPAACFHLTLTMVVMCVCVLLVRAGGPQAHRHGAVLGQQSRRPDGAVVSSQSSVWDPSTRTVR